jgi:hypothetical protein
MSSFVPKIALHIKYVPDPLLLFICLPLHPDFQDEVYYYNLVRKDVIIQCMLPTTRVRSRKYSVSVLYVETYHYYDHVSLHHCNGRYVTLLYCAQLPEF